MLLPVLRRINQSVSLDWINAKNSRSVRLTQQNFPYSMEHTLGFQGLTVFPRNSVQKYDFVVEIQLFGHEIQRVNPRREKFPAGQCAHEVWLD